ncbi:hypothetical protein F0562_034982 [Nyssa sinensis]|uniref:N-acetyltransferase domain-containing protein n=1 Tax=Nyssa sinensis TaxID=561372 RepID=A0A5J5A9I1_9ASTE|nr:hypothetical protein F0562_034982 [Nyssa sinensis]
MIFRTSRLRLLDLSDIDDFMVWTTDDQVNQFSSSEPFTTKEDAMNHIVDFIIPHPWYRAICLKDRPIGAILVTPNRGNDICRAELGYVLASKYWGKGIVTKAVKMVASTIFFDWPHLERLEALVDVNNPGSQRVLEKAGFQREGVLRKYYLHKGRPIDMAKSPPPTLSNSSPPQTLNSLLTAAAVDEYRPEDPGLIAADNEFDVNQDSTVRVSENYMSMLRAIERPLKDRESMLECRHRDFYSVLVAATKRDEERQRIESQQRKDGLVAKNRLMRSDERGVWGRVRPLALKPEDWERVVAVFVLGKEWQFKDWPFKDHVEIFNKIIGFYMRFEDDSVESAKIVKQWNVKIISISKNKRHQDRAAALEVWDRLEEFVRSRSRA